MDVGRASTLLVTAAVVAILVAASAAGTPSAGDPVPGARSAVRPARAADLVVRAAPARVAWDGVTGRRWA